MSSKLTVAHTTENVRILAAMNENFDLNACKNNIDRAAEHFAANNYYERSPNLEMYALTILY